MSLYRVASACSICLVTAMACLSTLCVEPVLAQQSGETVPLPPVTVEASQQPKKAKKTAAKKPAPKTTPQQSPTPQASTAPPPSSYQSATGPVKGMAAKQSATGTKTGTPLIETPQSISVITKEQIEQQGATTVSEALRYTPGVIVDLRPSNRYDIAPVRGFGPSTGGTLQSFVGYQDGLRLLRGVGQATPTIDPFTLERIEVLRGPASVLYGQSTPGGFVNLISKKPLDVAHGEIEVTTSNYARKEIGLDVGGPIDTEGKLAYRFVGLFREGDTQVEDVEEERLVLAPSLTFRPDKDTTLTVLGYYQNDPKSLYSVFLPAQGTLFANPNGQIPRDFNAGDPNYDEYKREVTAIGYQFEHRFDEVFTVRQNLRYMYIDMTLHGVQPSAFAADQKTITRAYSNLDETADTLTLDNQVEAKFATGPLRHTLLAGLDYQLVNADQLTAPTRSASIDFTNPVYTIPSGAPAAFTATAQVQSDQLGLYAQDQIKLGNWVAVVGGRHDSASFSFDQTTLATGAKTYIAQEDNAYSWRAGLVYLFGNGLAPYASYSTSFEPVTGQNLQSVYGYGDKHLEPTEGEQYEVGVKYEPIGWNTSFAVAAFDLTRTNVLTPDDAHTTGCGATKTSACYVQTGEVEGRGIELEARSSLTRNIDFIAAYTYQQTEITESNTTTELGKRPIQLPEHTASAWANYTFHEGSFAGLGIGFGVRYFGSTYGDAANTIEVPSVTLYDAGLQYDLSQLGRDWKGYSLSVNASNLFDKTYVASCGTGLPTTSSPVSCYWGTERTVEATLRYRW